MVNEKTVANEVDHLFRHEYGKLVSVLTKLFGSANMDLAEDVVQEAMLEALKKWTYEGIPKNQVGWIYRVAKYKAVNILKRENYTKQHLSDITNLIQNEAKTESSLDQIFTDREIEDDQLRMIFTCCHPVISIDSQIALTLKTLCGFSIAEIAQAFLTTEENINKRLVRARKTIRSANIPFEVPVGEELKSRLSAVLESIYLLFNEGYYASSGDALIRYELCEEAIRLAEIIVSNPNIKSSNTYALLALMTLNASRFRSRIDELNNDVLDLENQNREHWDKVLINKGLHYLEFAASQNEVSRYHILATISAQHCTAPDYDSTDWKSILHLYNMLLRIDDSPVVHLNKAIVLSKINGPEQALLELDKIEENRVLRTYFPYYITKASLHFQNKEPEMAMQWLHEALQRPIEEHQKTLVMKLQKEFSGRS